MKVSVYVIAYNEKDKIVECINSVKWADEIILADSYSTDGTSEIAKKMGVIVHQIKFNGFGDLRNQAIAKCSNEWILSIDSDERCTPEVEKEIKTLILQDKYDIFKIPRRNFFMGKWIKYSGWYPNYRQPQLFKKGAMKYDLKPVHEGFINLTKKPIGILKNSIWQIPFKNFEEIMHKANKYSTLGVDKLIVKKKKGSVSRAFFHGSWSFLKHYIFKFGFLDGGPGLVIACANFEGTFYRYLKLYETQSNWKEPLTK